MMVVADDVSIFNTSRAATWLVCSSVFCLSMLLSVATYFYAGSAVPVLHDEFASLLQADTFAHGRLTNPPHPMADSLETFHVLQHPTYQGKFPPGYALFLSLGEIIWHPQLGSWLSIALGCSAVCWMLLAWFPPNWSALGGVLAATSLTTHLLTTSYWGGGVAMLGGALSIGACLRMMRAPTFGSGMIAGLGAMFLVNSRPFEGALFCTALAGIVTKTIVQNRSLRRTTFVRALPGALVVVLPLLAWDCYYNARVTGSPWRLPYTLHAEQYMHAPLMYWQSPHVPTVEAPEPIKSFHAQQEWQEYEAQTSWSGFREKAKTKILYLLRTYFYPPWLSIPLLLSLAALRRNQAVRWCFGIGLCLPLLHIALTPWLRWIYFLPLTGLLIGAMVAGLMMIDRWRLRRWRVGRAIVFLLLITQFTSSVAWAKIADRAPKPPPAELRAALIERLSAMGGKHLVLITALPGEGSVDMVFNGADIDASPVIFARDLGEPQNAALLAYFSDRDVWHVDPSLAVTHVVTRSAHSR